MRANAMARKTIKVNYMARVEGEASLKVVIRDGKVEIAEFNIFEPPRFFEAMLRGRNFTEAPDITARICGICPVAYQMSAVYAMENALGVVIPEPIRLLRRLLYCGEWIESHGLHIYMLHAPDFLGYENAIAMAADHPEKVQQGLTLKKAGNAIVNLLGGREIHPINVRVGGFYRVPRKRELQPLLEQLKQARELAVATVNWVSGFDFPDFERDYELVALKSEHEYPFCEGRIASNKGLDIGINEYDACFEETHLARSNALQSHIRGRGSYLCGPMARFALNFDQLSPLARQLAGESRVGPGCRNPYQSIVIRAIELLHVLDEAVHIIENYHPPETPAIEVTPHPATGYGATEAPRGLLYHRYRLEQDGSIADARIVPPTSQNQACMEADLETFIPGWLDLNDADLQWRCEQTMRNYDPCISCATHFLRLEVDRE